MEDAKINIFWFRRDLRLDDNTGLYHALRDGLPVLPLFIFDENILTRLQDRQDARVSFIHAQIYRIKTMLESSGSSLLIRYGRPEDVFREIFLRYPVIKLFTNHDYEPYASERDARVSKLAASMGVAYHSFKDQVVFEKNEVMKEDGRPYTVFTPYSQKWAVRLAESGIPDYPSESMTGNMVRTGPFPDVHPEDFGFGKGPFSFPPLSVDADLISNYHLNRDFPSRAGTTRLSVHLRFGTISIRKLARMAMNLNKTFLNELIWREFYMMILFHFPHVADGSFRRQYDRINWKNDEKLFQAWCLGKTGYPIVDAGMRELNATGYMHNRVRMITASFLTKHLLTDWRWGEAYFAGKLLDYELSSNNGGWQWAAGTGCDAAPYFRVFNPALQAMKFDPGSAYIRKWVAEYGTSQYPAPVVDHAKARNDAIQAYKLALQGPN